MLWDNTLAVAIGNELAAEREELVVRLAAARREPDLVRREQLLAELQTARDQFRRNDAERMCTEARLRRVAVQQMMARLIGESAPATI